MKIKNIILALLAVAAFSACSNNDDIVPPVQEEMTETAYLSLGIVETSTLRAIDENMNERFVNSLHALVFNGAGELVAKKDTINEGDMSIGYITGIKLTFPYYYGESSPERFQVVLFANAEGKFDNIENLSDIKTVLSDNIEEYALKEKPFLPMSSKVLSFTGMKRDTENWLKMDGETNTTLDYSDSRDPDDILYYGDEYITLRRLHSRVDLNSISVKFDETYAGSNFYLDSVFLVNVRENSTFNYGDFENVDAAYKRGIESDFTPVDGKVDPTMGPGACVEHLGTGFFGLVIRDNETWDDNLLSAYVYENKGQYTTRLVIVGTITTLDGQGAKIEKKYYSIPIEETEGVGTLANTRYSIDATIKSTGNPGLDKDDKFVAVSAKITVKDWELVEDPHDIDEKVIAQ